MNSKAIKGFSCLIALIWLAGLASVWGQGLTRERSVLDAGGDRLGGGALTHINAFGQPGGILTLSAQDTMNYQGFMGGFDLRPDLDTDGDGLADEVDGDNDDDGLEDAAELSGSAFDPVTPTRVGDADCDGDNVSDGEEALAGTDPWDATAFLRVTNIARLAGPARTRIDWRAREGRTYGVYYRSDPRDASHVHLDNVSPTGGAGAWLTTSAGYEDASSSNVPARHYSVRTGP